MINIKKGRYWDEGITLVSSCTRVSVGCENCWALAMDYRFRRSGSVESHRERLCKFQNAKPTIFSIWNDLFHPVISDSFQNDVYKTMIINKQHTYLILTKRPERMADFLSPNNCFTLPSLNGIWHGLTVCNQQEADKKIPIFLQVPGKKFLSIEPMLGPLNLTIKYYAHNMNCLIGYGGWRDYDRSKYKIDAVILGCETGSGARPLHPDWVRSVRDQCAAAGVPFFLKQLDKKHNRILDGYEHNALPWVTP